jgi:chloramphenicol O-acetyltransferase type A
LSRFSLMSKIVLPAIKVKEMKQLLDIETWSRKEHFHFFRRFDEPFFGVCVEIDCTGAYGRAKESNTSFFLQYLHATLQAANQTKPFRYRINQGQVWIYDVVHASPTIDRPDGTFAFSYIDYYEDFSLFEEAASKEIEKVRQSTGIIPSGSDMNVVHCSAMPWLNFTSVSHARSFSFEDSCPKISFGKMREQHGRKLMPVSVHVHHALMDGRDVALFVDLLEELMG